MAHRDPVPAYHQRASGAGSWRRVPAVNRLAREGGDPSRPLPDASRFPHRRPASPAPAPPPRRGIGLVRLLRQHCPPCTTPATRRRRHTDTIRSALAGIGAAIGDPELPPLAHRPPQHAERFLVPVGAGRRHPEVHRRRIVGRLGQYAAQPGPGAIQRRPLLRRPLGAQQRQPEVERAQLRDGEPHRAEEMIGRGATPSRCSRRSAPSRRTRPDHRTAPGSRRSLERAAARSTPTRRGDLVRSNAPVVGQLGDDCSTRRNWSAADVGHAGSRVGGERLLGAVAVCVDHLQRRHRHDLARERQQPARERRRPAAPGSAVVVGASAPARRAVGRRRSGPLEPRKSHHRLDAARVAQLPRLRASGRASSSSKSAGSRSRACPASGR